MSTSRIKIFLVESSSAVPSCPCCGGILRYRDSRSRIQKKEGGERRFLQIRRFRCEQCLAYHNELPDCVVPYKHYETEVISGVIDQVVTPSDLDSEDHPCAQTMLRWIAWFLGNLANLEGSLRREWYQLSRISEEELFAHSPLLDLIRSFTSRWLETILRIIYNSGDRIPAFPG